MAGTNLFNSVKMTKPNKNRFDLTHDVKLSFDMGYLVPTLAMDCVPGDKFTIGCDALVRFAPMIAPVMHRFDIYTHYFFVPNRILWDNWENFITNTPVGGNIPAAPFVEINAGTYNSLYDYFGIPIPITDHHEAINALPFSAYNKIYNEYYRDENLCHELNYKLVDGENDPGMFTIRKRAWEHDYFTSNLPFAQKGAAVEIPLGTFNDVPVKYESGIIPGGALGVNTTPGSSVSVGDASAFPSLPPGELFAQTSTLVEEATTINDLRKAFKLQEWLEKAARGGSRYVENILAFFGVRSSDKRLQRPEYITGMKSPIIVSEVLNMTGETGGLPQANMAGHGVGVGSGTFGSYFCEEHGWIIGITSMMPKTAYQQGIHKSFLKFDQFDYYWPPFANLGEQAVTNREIYAFQDESGRTFGYVPRYAEYRFMPNRVAGDFRTDLDFWHEGRIFSSPPSLNQDFIECTPDNRIFAVETDVNHIYAQILHKISASRPMPKYGTPGF